MAESEVPEEPENLEPAPEEEEAPPKEALIEALTPDPAAEKPVQSPAPTAQKKSLAVQNEDEEPVFHTLKFVEDLPLRLHAEIANRSFPLRHILSWKKGGIVEFNQIVGEPIEVFIGNHLIAKGEVVVINEHYGVRISEITHPNEVNRGRLY